jgi:hypothetical protein
MIAISFLSNAAVVFRQVLCTLCRGITPWVVFRFFAKLGIVSIAIFSPVSSLADTLAISFPLALDSSVGITSSTGQSLNGNLVRAGIFTVTPSQLLSNLATKTSASDIRTTIHASFTQFTSFSMADAYLNDPDQAQVSLDGSISTTFRGKDVYLLFYNNASFNDATEMGIFRMAARADVPGEGVGVFPTSDDGFSTRISLFNFSDPDQLVGPESFLNLLVGQYNATTESYTLGALEGGIGQITSPLTETNASGVASTYQITANNGADRFFATTNTGSVDLTLTNLPVGFSIATNTGVITAGTNAAANTYSIRLVASNSLTASVATNTLTWTLQASSLSFTTTTNLINAVAGVEISPFTFVSTGTSPTYSADGNLRGLILSTNGLLSGIPSSVGTNDVTITSSAGGQNGTTTFSLAVAAPTISVPAGELTGGQIVHTAGTARTVTLNKSAGFTDLTGLVSPTTSGVSFNGTDLVIAADAVPLLKGLNNINLTLTASKVGVSGASASTTVPLRIVAPTPTRLVGPTEFEVDVGQAFSTTILSDAGTYGEMSFSNLPDLAGFANGQVSGINRSTSLPYEFAVKVVADSTQTYEGGGTYTNTNVIFRLRNANPPYFAGTNRYILSVGRAVSGITFNASNFPFRYTVSNLPPGLQLNGNRISGVPTVAINSQVQITAYNSYRPGSTNPADEQPGYGTLILNVAGARPTAATPLSGSSNLRVGNAASFSMLSAQELGLRISGYGFPPGLSINSSTGLVTGTPTAAGTYSVTIFLQNGRGWIKKNVTLTVQ